MTFNITDKRLRAALDPGRIGFLLESKLKNFGKEDFKIKQLHIPRVFPNKDKSYTIQYLVHFNNDKRGETFQRIYSGHLSNEEITTPSYVDKNKMKVITDPQTGLVISIFPYDPSLQILEEIIDKEKLKSILGNYNLLPECNEMPAFELITEVLAYRLQKRCTLSIQLGYASNGDGKASVQKIILRVSKSKKINAYHKALSYMNQAGFDKNAEDKLNVSEILAVDIKRGLLFLEFVEGCSLHELTSDGSFESGCSSAAKLIAKVHSLPIFELPSYSWEDELEMLARNVKLFSSLFPELQDIAELNYSNLVTGAGKVKDYELSCIHRDYYDKQVLYSKEGCTLLDCDNLSIGDPASDYGNFLAHLILRSRQEPNNEENIQVGISAFRHNYTRSEKKFQERVKWWSSAALIRLATLYSLRPRWQHLRKPLLDDAICVANGDFNEKVLRG